MTRDDNTWRISISGLAHNAKSLRADIRTAQEDMIAEIGKYEITTIRLREALSRIEEVIWALEDCAEYFKKGGA